MENEIKSKKSIEIWEILKRSLSLYKENFSLFIGIIILGYVLSLLNTLRMIILKTTYAWIGFITSWLGILIVSWAYIALVIAISNRYLNNKITLKECFIAAKEKYWRYIGICILYGLILGAGLLLFLIPGIYWGTIFSLASITVVLEKRRDIGPLRISKELIRGYFWRVFLLELIILLFSLYLYFIYFGLAKINQNLATILLQIFLLFYTPFYIGVSVTLYYILKDIKEGELPIESEIPVKCVRGYLGYLVAAGLVILIILLSIFWSINLMKFFKKDINKEKKICEVGKYRKKEPIPVKEINEEKLEEIIMLSARSFNINIDTINRKDNFLEVKGVADNIRIVLDFMNNLKDKEIKPEITFIKEVEENKNQFTINCYY